MTQQLTAQEFIDMLTSSENVSLDWSKDSTRLQLSVIVEDRIVQYLAPNVDEIPINAYMSFVWYVAHLWRKKTGKDLPDFPETKKSEPVSEEIMTAEKFLEVTRNSKSISVGKDNNTGGLFIVVKYHTDEGEDDLVKAYQGPDPMTTVYGEYMQFLAELYSTPGLSSFVETYQKNILRLMGRMTQ